jgi:uncharacterized glyoxalase superfamily protein PhnB
MAERDLIEQLNRALEAMMPGRNAAPSPLEPRIAGLLRVAEDLQDLPDQAFRERLKTELLKQAAQRKETKNMATSAATASYIRKDFHTVTPYLILNGGAGNFIEFVKKAFNAEERFRVPSPGGSIVHAEVKIGDSVIELADANEQFPATPTGLHLFTPDVDAVYAQAIAAGARERHAIIDQPYGDREGSVRDAFGNDWYIATHKQDLEGHRGTGYVPEGLRNVNIYLHPRGTPQLIEFMKQAFDAEEVVRAQSPEGTIVHAKIRIGDSIIEVGEAHGQWQPMPATLHLYVPDANATYRRAIEAGATSIMEPTDQPYGDRSGGIRDAFGNQWFIATHLRDVAPPG